MPSFQLTHTLAFGQPTDPVLTMRRGLDRAEIRRSVDEMAARATLVFPRPLTFRGRRLEDIIQKKMPVRIRLGVDYIEADEFVGFVSGVKPGDMVEVQCEDCTFALKQKRVQEAFPSGTQLSTVLDYLVAQGATAEPWWDGTRREMVELAVGSLRIGDNTAAEVLQLLRESYGQLSFFRQNVDGAGIAAPALVVGQAYSRSTPVYHDYDLGRTCLPGNSLEWRREEDVKTRFKAINLLPNGTTQEVDFGPSDGNLHTLHFVDTPGFEAAARAKAARIRFEGYAGSFETYGFRLTGGRHAFAEPGDIARITDPDYPDRGGSYAIKETVVQFAGGSDFRRTITLGPKAAQEGGTA